MNNSKYLLLIVFCFLASCKKDNSITPTIVGQWQWIKSTGGIAGATMTPQSTGRTWNITFNPDLSFIETGTFVNTSQGTYKLSIVNSSNTLTLFFTNVFEPYQTEYSYLFSGKDTLWISQNMIADGFNNAFVRK